MRVLTPKSSQNEANPKARKKGFSDTEKVPKTLVK